jgi:hypothetical protein
MRNLAGRKVEVGAHVGTETGSGEDRCRGMSEKEIGMGGEIVGDRGVGAGTGMTMTETEGGGSVMLLKFIV